MRWTALFLVALVMAMLPATSLAQAPDPDSEDNFTLRINDTLVVGPDERLDTVVVLNADIDVQGTVTDALVVVGGTATVRDGAIVDGEITVINGDLVLDSGSVVDDVSLVRSDITRDPDATVRGSVEETSDFLFFGWGSAILAGVVFWLGVTLAVLAAGAIFALIAGRQLATAAAYMTERVGQSILGAVVLVIGLPILAVILMITLVGIPTGLGLLLFVLPVLLFLGYLVAGTWLGTLILSRTGHGDGRPVAQALLGLAILQLLLPVPIVGWIIFPIAGIWGAGALVYYAFNALRGRSQGATGQRVEAT